MSNMVVQTNVLALNAHRNMKGVGGIQDKASQKLASGFRINSAADDAAGLAISEKMRAQIRGLDMASKNSQDAISLIQTAEGGMQEIDNMIQRIRELVVYASNDTLDPDNKTGAVSDQGDRQKVQDEISSLMKEIDSMAGRVEFNKKTLLDGSFDGKGAASTSLTPAQLATIDGAIATFRVGVTDALTDVYDSGGDIGALFDAAEGKGLTSTQITGYKDALAGIIRGFESSILRSRTAADVANAKSSMDTAIKALGTRITDENPGSVDTDEMGDLLDELATGNTLLSDLTDAADTLVGTANFNDRPGGGGGSIYFQVGPNANQGWTLNIGNITSQGLGLASGPITETGIVESTGGNIDTANLINVLEMTGEGALTGLLDTIDSALSIVTTERAKLGAAQNRLEYTIKSLDISSENLSASESRIRDTDMAKEMMNLTKANVLQQSTISILSQANQNPMSLLSLLR